MAKGIKDLHDTGEDVKLVKGLAGGIDEKVQDIKRDTQNIGQDVREIKERTQRSPSVFMHVLTLSPIVLQNRTSSA